MVVKRNFISSISEQLVFFMRFLDKIFTCCNVPTKKLARISENQTRNLLLATTQILILSVMREGFYQPNVCKTGVAARSAKD